MPALKERPKPFVLPEFCKGCGRCISACPVQNAWRAFTTSFALSD